MGDGANKPANAPTTAMPNEFNLLIILTEASSKYTIKVPTHIGANFINGEVDFLHGFYQF